MGLHTSRQLTGHILILEDVHRSEVAGGSLVGSQCLGA